MRQSSRPGSPSSWAAPSASRSSNLVPLMEPVVQLPESLPVVALPDVTVTRWLHSVETFGELTPGFGKEQVQPTWATSRTLKMPGLTPSIVYWPRVAIVLDVVASGSPASLTPL